MLMRCLLAGFLLSGVWFGMQLWLTHTFLKKGRNRLTFFTIACCVYSDCAYPPFERFVFSQFLGLIKREAVGTHRGNASCYLSGKGAERKDAPNRGEAGTPVGLYGSRICGDRPAPYDAVLCDIFAGCVGMRRDLVRLPQCAYLVRGDRHSGSPCKADHGKEFCSWAAPHNSARSLRQDFCSNSKFRKWRNTVCISHFRNCGSGAKRRLRLADAIARCCSCIIQPKRA